MLRSSILAVANVIVSIPRHSGHHNPCKSLPRLQTGLLTDFFSAKQTAEVAGPVVKIISAIISVLIRRYLEAHRRSLTGQVVANLLESIVSPDDLQEFLTFFCRSCSSRNQFSARA